MALAKWCQSWRAVPVLFIGYFFRTRWLGSGGRVAAAVVVCGRVYLVGLNVE